MEIRRADGKYETRSYIGNPSQQWGATAPLANGQLGLTASGSLVTSETALQLAAVWGSTALISESIATLPIRQWRLQKSGDPKAVDLSPVIDSPWRPWEQFTMRDFIVQGSMSFLLRGNVFGKVLEFTDDYRPAQVELKNPSETRIRRNFYTGEVEVFYDNASEKTPESMVTRAMALSFAGGIVGLSPVSYMRNVLGLALAQDRMAGAFFANSATPRGLIKVKGDLDPNETRALRESWLEAHQGANHAYLPAVITGDAEYQPITMPLEDAQFLQQMQYSASVISGMIYRIPPHMVGMADKSTSWGAGIEQQEMGFVRNTLLIWLCRWEDWLTSWLAPGQFVTFDLSERLRGDALQRWSAWQIARVIGAMNNAEIRKAEGLPPGTDPTLEDFAAPLNSAPMKPASSSAVGPGGDKAN